ncbi:MAG: PDZ domain-containing protein [FCB group bacterium]|jgi:serine protease Do|nr:PDZ domain-containing protein [FCB group bacterium]
MLNSLVLALLLAASNAGATAAPEMSQATIERAYNELSPALCVIAYSFEITNPKNNERVKQDAHTPGLIVSPDGLVLARGHMIGDNIEPFNIRVSVGHGDAVTEHPAVLLQKPTSVNVAMLRITSDKPLQLPFARFKPDVRLSVGEPIAVLGVLGAAFDYTPSVVVRRIGSILDTPRTTYCLDDPVPPGFTGGPVVNVKGEVVGVVGYDLSTSEGGDLYVRSGFPLVYQTELFAKYLATPPAEAGDGDADAPSWLGVFTQPLTDELAQYWSLPAEGGSVVSTVMAGSPAAIAGIQRGDIIVAFDGKPVRSKQDRDVFAFTRMIRETPVDKPVVVKVLRDRQPLEVTVTLAPQPVTSGRANEFEDKVFGLTVRELTRDVRIMLNLPEDVQGVIVRRVQSGSWAALANMRPGIIILSFGGHAITSIEDYEQAVAAVAAEKPLEVSVFSRVGAVTGFFRLEPRWEDVKE